MKNVWIVGESFQNVAEHDGAWTAAEAIATLIGKYALREPVLLRPGLGISAVTWRKVQSLARQSDAVFVDTELPQPADCELVNKRFESNVSIGDPVRTAVDCFAADLLITDDSEMIRDQPADRLHVPGFALAEAAAQLVRWAVKVRFPASQGEPPRYAVMHAMRCHFDRFTFPVPARLAATFDVGSSSSADRIPVTAVIDIAQGGRTVTTCEFDFHAFRPEHIFAIEDSQARKLLNMTRG